MVLDSTAHKLDVFLVPSIEINTILVGLAPQRIARAFPRESCPIALAQGILVKRVRPERWNFIWRIQMLRPEAEKDVGGRPVIITMEISLELRQL